MTNSVCISIAGLMLACAAGAVQADIISPDPYALGGGRHYSQTSPPVAYHGSFFDVFATLDFTMTGPAHDPAQPGTGDNLGSSGHDGIMTDRNGNPVRMTGQSSFFDVFFEISPDGLARSYNTEMLSMDLQGDDPVLGHVMIRESPTLQSNGYYISARIYSPDAGGQLYQIHSFFDVFTELSLDGGQTWTPADGAMHMELDGPSVPAPGVASFLALSGAFAVRRRR